MKKCPSFANAMRPADDRHHPRRANLGTASRPSAARLFAIGENAAGGAVPLAPLPGLDIARVPRTCSFAKAGCGTTSLQSALSLARHGRNAVDAFPLLPIRGDEVECADLLGDQHPAVRQERHRPGQFEVGHHLYLERQIRRLAASRPESDPQPPRHSRPPTARERRLLRINRIITSQVSSFTNDAQSYYGDGRCRPT